jgi:hypothetical protein
VPVTAILKGPKATAATIAIIEIQAHYKKEKKRE